MAEPHRSEDKKIIPASSLNPDKIHTWPHLVRVEFVVGLIFLIGLTLLVLIYTAMYSRLIEG